MKIICLVTTHVIAFALTCTVQAQTANSNSIGSESPSLQNVLPGVDTASPKDYGPRVNSTILAGQGRSASNGLPASRVQLMPKIVTESDHDFQEQMRRDQNEMRPICKV